MGEAERRMYKPSVCTCGKWEKRKDACINQASVPAESGRSGKAHIQTKRLYLRKVREAEKRMYKPSVCTCGKCERWKAHVQTGHLYLRKYGCRKVWAQFRQPYALRGRKKSLRYLGGIFQNESNHFYISIHFGRHNIESAFFCIKLYIFFFVSGCN